MGTNGGGGVVDGVALWRLQAILVRGWNPNPDANLFFTNFCTNSYKRSYTYCIVRIRIRCGFCTNSYNFLYDLYITNSYNDYFLYELYSTISYNDNMLYELYSTNSYNEQHTSCPDQAAPGCPDVRVHPAAPTFRVHPAARR
jgi:hypothetical protein